MFKASILDFDSLAPDDLNTEPLKALPVDWQFYHTTAESEKIARMQGQDIILTNKVVLDAKTLEAAKDVRLIVVLATGIDNVDVAAAKRLGIAVCNIVAYSTESVVQQTFAKMLALQTHLRTYDQAVKSGRWCDSPFFGFLEYPFHELAGKTLGIIGYGAIGKRVAEIARAFKMQVQVCQSLSATKQENRVPLQTLLASSDVVSVHSPLTPESKGLITEKELALMKPSAILLNLGRGGIVNEHDLAKALKNNTIAGAGIDVLAKEPPEKDNPLLDETLENLIISPHTAWASVEARQELIRQVAEIVRNFPDEPFINRVDA